MSERCRVCGPGYRYGDEGCRHTPPSEPTLTEEDREALIVALLEPDDDCAHNYAPLYADAERIVARHRAEAAAAALRAAADAFQGDYAMVWGGPAAWLTTGDRVGELVADCLREDADDPDFIRAAILQGREDAR